MRRQDLDETLRLFPSNEHPLQLHEVYIDGNFMQLYPPHGLPDLRAGDLVFCALARGENRILITEDQRLFRGAIEAGVPAYGIEAYLAA
jgi:hypothetical protein